MVITPRRNMDVHLGTGPAWSRGQYVAVSCGQNVSKVNFVRQCSRFSLGSRKTHHCYNCVRFFGDIFKISPQIPSRRHARMIHTDACSRYLAGSLKPQTNEKINGQMDSLRPDKPL